jgi:hypothetical protein
MTALFTMTLVLATTTPQPPDETVVVIEAAPLQPPQDEQSEPKEEEILVITEDSDDDASSTGPAPQAEVPPQPTGPKSNTRVKLELSSRLLADTQHAEVPEDVTEWWNEGLLNIRHSHDSGFRIGINSAVRWGAAGKHPGPENPYLVINPRDPTWLAETDLKEAWVQWDLGPWQITAGEQIYSWGKNDFMAAADQINPLDMRFDPTRNLANPRNAKVPVFGIDAAYHHEETKFQMVIMPFFRQHRASLSGRDFALAPPGSGLAVGLGNGLRFAPELEDEVQEAVFRSQVPDQTPKNISAAARITTSISGWDLGISGYFGWDRLPKLSIDEDLLTILRASDQFTVDPQSIATNPTLRDASLAVQQKVAVGQTLIRARYRRYWTLAVEAAKALGDVMLRLDAGVTPRQTLYTNDFISTRGPTIMAALGAEYSYGELLYISVTPFLFAALDPPKHQSLLLLESHGDTGDRTAALYGVNANLRLTWTDQQTWLVVSGNYNVQPGDHFLVAQWVYAYWEPHEFSVGVVTVNGPQGTAGRFLKRNDYAFVGYRSVW